MGKPGLLWNWSWSVTLFFREAFIPWLVCSGKWKMQSHTESAQTLHLFCLSKPGFFLHTFPINNIVYIIFWPWRPVNILWSSFDKGFSTRKLIFPWNVFSYISNVCQPEKEREGEGEREKEKSTGWPSFFGELGPLLLFSKGTFIP